MCKLLMISLLTILVGCSTPITIQEPTTNYGADTPKVAFSLTPIASSVNLTSPLSLSIDVINLSTDGSPIHAVYLFFDNLLGKDNQYIIVLTDIPANGISTKISYSYDCLSGFNSSATSQPILKKVVLYFFKNKINYPVTYFL